MSRRSEHRARYARWRDELTIVRMLYAFHVDQNKRRPGSVHATYMLIGYRRAPGTKNSPGSDEDVVMTSSPFNSTQRDDKESEEKCVVVVSQEKLEETRLQLSRLVSIHVYSLEPTALTDLNAISSTCQDILSQFADEDKLAMWSTYGTIHNSVAKVNLNNLDLFIDEIYTIF